MQLHFLKINILKISSFVIKFLLNIRSFVKICNKIQMNNN